MNLREAKRKIHEKNCIIEIFGIGYVGFPLSIRLASSGFNIIGVDTNEKRIKELESNRLKQSENNLEKEFVGLRLKKKLLFSKSSIKSKLPRIGIICVPTPISSKKNGSNIYVKEAVENFLVHAKRGDSLIIESSLEIGSYEYIKSHITKKGFSVGKDFGLAYCPERIDPLNKNWNLHNIPRVIYCEDDTTFEIAKLVYQGVNQANLVRVYSSKVAEVVKSFENTFRLVNISLVNELAIFCDSLGISVSEVIEAASTKPFGFIPFYTGAGAGGHCIPKDPMLLLNSAKNFDFDFTLVRKSLEINEFIPKYIAKRIDGILNDEKLPKKVLVVGLSYKANLEDMRDSPGLKIIHELFKKRFKISVYDPFFNEKMIKEHLFQNNKKEINLKVFENFDDINDKPSCLILVQHHTRMKNKIKEIYHKSHIPVIFDCQNKLKENTKSSTILVSFGD
jgi:nucleotide sugar dehydrogenase